MCYTAADDEDDVVVALVSRKGRAASLSPPAQADEDSTAPRNALKQPPAVSDSPIKDANSPARHVDSKKMSSQKVRLCYPIWAADSCLSQSPVQSPMQITSLLQSVCKFSFCMLLCVCPGLLSLLELCANRCHSRVTL